MRISGPFVVGMLFVGMSVIAGLAAPINAWGLEVARLDEFLWISAIQGTKDSPVTLANPWTERRVQRYLKAVREQLPPAGPLARDSFVAWEETDFFGVAGQGRTTSRAKTRKRTRTACCSVCCLY